MGVVGFGECDNRAVWQETPLFEKQRAKPNKGRGIQNHAIDGLELGEDARPGWLVEPGE